MRIFQKYAVPIIAFLVFTLVGCVVWMIRDVRYFYLFAGIGVVEALSRTIVIHYPKVRQFLRISIQLLIGGFLIGWLSLFIGVNFQFPQIFFDASAGVVTGALIQVLIARVVLPFFLGNAFCSRACWSGVFFEFTDSKKRISKPPPKRSELLAWSYLVALIMLALVVSFYDNPAVHDETRKAWIIGENLFIVVIGFVLTFVTGSRSYCRLLCPFITISSIFAKYSLFKITPYDAEKCTLCNACNRECPMYIDVRSDVVNNSTISDKLCIVCENCVSACPHDVLKLTYKKPVSVFAGVKGKFGKNIKIKKP